MLEEIKILIELQGIDNVISKLEELLGDMPPYMVDAENSFNEFNKNYEEAVTKFDKLKHDQLQLEKDYHSKKNLLDNAQKKLSSVKNSKEYEAVLKELDTLKKEINDEELKLVELSETIEQLEKDKTNFNEAKEKAMTVFDEAKNNKEKDDADNKSELASLKENRGKVILSIKKQLLSKYDTIRKVRNNIAIVRVNNEICTGCFMKVPPQLYVEVKKNVSIHQCPNCQRFLYYKEDETE